jgi:UDP-2,3-diacylglucosamine pyrophosphatase LpxH
MTEDTYVISDIHLGGNPALAVVNGTVDFQMCPRESRRRLARFIHSLRVGNARSVRLIINGDLVDFLAEESDGLPVAASEPARPRFESFTANEARAVAKLDRIVARADEGAPSLERIFDALRAFLGDGHALQILLGNHDLELTYPAVRRRLTSILTEDRPARLEYILDGEALPLGNLLIEHGNRYDGWNAVAHGQLRALRARVSRDERPYPFDPPAGSRLVGEVINGFKSRLRFIDLLKPETEALIPVLTALDRRALWGIDKIFAASVAWQQWRQSIKPGRLSEDESFVAGGVDRPVAAPAASGGDIDLLGDVADQASYQRTLAILAREKGRLAGPVEDTAVAGGGTPPIDYKRLRQSFVERASEITASYRLDSELPIYRDAAKRLSGGTRTVIFGHTHLEKYISLEGGGTYINTGTWCPTIQVPEPLLNADIPVDAVLSQVEAFVTDLGSNALGARLRLCTTFAHIAPDGAARLCEYHEDGSVTTVSP